MSVVSRETNSRERETVPSGWVPHAGRLFELRGTSAEMIGKHYDNVTDLQVSKKILSKKMKFVGDEVIGITTPGGKECDDE